MWIGERITENGVGNGISIVLLINIISRVPSDFVTLYNQFMSGKKLAQAGLAGLIIIAVILIVVIFVVLMQSGERRIAVQYSKKVQGRKTYGGQSTHIPLRVNTAGVVPVIFASSLMQTPIVIAGFLGKGNGTGIGSQILAGLNSSNWCDPSQPIYSIGLVVYILLTVFFAYFYTSITFNPGYTSRKADSRVSAEDPQLHHFHRRVRTGHRSGDSVLIQWCVWSTGILWRNIPYHHCRSRA